MAIITKKQKILTMEKMVEIEKILCLDGIHTDCNGNFLLTSPDGRLIMISELETIFSKIKEKKNDKRRNG